MKQTVSRNDKSVPRTHMVLQMSALERSRRYHAPAAYRLAPQAAAAASVIARFQLMMSRSFTGLMIVLVTLFFPIGAFAQESVEPEVAAPATTEEVQQSSAEQAQPELPPQKKQSAASKTSPKKPASKPAKPQAAPKKPHDAETSKYTFNKETGLWENGVHAWDPATGQSKPMQSKDYSYNPKAKAWDSTDWRYDPKEGKYVPNSVSIAPQHDGSEVKLGNTSSEFFALYNDARISNTLNSSAQSGDAWVTGNTSAGSALTGDALAIANIFNLINSTAGLSGGSEVATFSSDIYGDVFGDMYIDPAALAALQPATSVGDGSTRVNVNADINQKITNDVDLSARSGDATVSKNTSAGDATSGDANAVVNIVNMLNSAISSGSVFLGLLNIYGNLNGDILLPPGMLDKLLASNSSHTSNSGKTSLDTNLSDKQSIINNVTTAATSGDATVSKNTSAGSATTGDTQTNVTILNLTGRNVVAANSLLVFVNVLGEWVGVIVDAPAGSTSAALGTGVTENTHKRADYDVNITNEIVNNVHVNAQSGDATVFKNTSAGDATSGNATASANIANIINSSFSLSGWLGVLFINVFGTWHGSFGIDTAAGNKPTAPTSSSKATPKGKGNLAPKVFRFVPTGSGGSSGGGATLATVDMSNPANAQAVDQAFRSAQEKIVKQSSGPAEDAPVKGAAAIDSGSSSTGTPTSADYTLPVLGFMLGSLLLGGERLFSQRQRRIQPLGTLNKEY